MRDDGYSHVSMQTSKTSRNLANKGCPEWCESWVCKEEGWCKDGGRPDDCEPCGCPDWCASWSCSEAWCRTGRRPTSCLFCEAVCPDWCDEWSCNEAWCRDGGRPDPCTGCCPSWCNDWQCHGEAWCQGGARPSECAVCWGSVQGPATSTGPTGWVLDHAASKPPEVHEHTLRLTGSSRVCAHRPARTCPTSRTLYGFD